jgi:uncharacterized membrane protein
MADTLHSVVAFKVADIQTAHSLFQELSRLDEADDNIKIIDAAAAYKTADNKLKIEQSSDLTGTEGTVGGGIIGVVTGLVIAGPIGAVVGGLAGGALGGIYGKLRDSGIDNKLIKDVMTDLAPNEAALMILYSGEISQDMLGSLADHGSSMMYGTLSAEIRDKVAAAMAGVDGEVVSKIEIDMVNVPADPEAGTPAATVAVGAAAVGLVTAAADGSDEENVELLGVAGFAAVREEGSDEVAVIGAAAEVLPETTGAAAAAASSDAMSAVVEGQDAKDTSGEVL